MADFRRSVNKSNTLNLQMSRYREWDLSCKVYVGNLGTNASKYEIEKVFSKYGNVRNVWVARNPPGFAFVEFEDPRDAEDSVRGLDGTCILSTNHQHTNCLTTSVHHMGSFTTVNTATAVRHTLVFSDLLSAVLRAANDSGHPTPRLATAVT
ncbi:RNA-binding protein 1 [Eumeta japonica]|uniref:RNA-binding protein 1 n=1 Tax=Eumeta variegata TaxID=151549 RepID=A0A4C1YQG9_EUMVA|nr:RNA-binding protein 1 [Eumeta japonica]